MNAWGCLWLGAGFALGCFFIGIAAENVATSITDTWLQMQRFNPLNPNGDDDETD